MQPSEDIAVLGQVPLQDATPVVTGKSNFLIGGGVVFIDGLFGFLLWYRVK